MTDHTSPEYCARCSRELVSGKGDFYLIKIEAVADPAPPMLDAADLTRGSLDELDRLFGELHDLSEQESLDQVYRRLTIMLCRVCYDQWIEQPAV